MISHIHTHTHLLRQKSKTKKKNLPRAKLVISTDTTARLQVILFHRRLRLVSFGVFARIAISLLTVAITKTLSVSISACLLPIYRIGSITVDRCEQF